MEAVLGEGSETIIKVHWLHRERFPLGNITLQREIQLKEACMKFNEIQEEYRKFKEESCKLRERCDEKIREEMINFSHRLLITFWKF